MRRSPLAFAMWCLMLPVLVIAHSLCFVLCEFFVVLMPMAKVGWVRGL